MLLGIAVLLISLASWAVGEPVQYCRFDQQNSRGATANFCLGIATYHNASSHEHDIYVSMQVTRSSPSDALGWAAFGTGSMMAGSLMFIVYGDPSSQHKSPTLSIRTVDGHDQPRLLTQDDLGGVSFRVIKTDWTPASLIIPEDTEGMIAHVSLVCYACGKWPGAPISAHSIAQPWIWAFDNRQESDVYSEDMHLKAHAHEAGNGGWGRFYVDMARSVSTNSTPSAAPIRPGVAELGASRYLEIE